MLNKHTFFPIIDDRSSSRTWERKYVDDNRKVVKKFTFQNRDTDNENISVERDEAVWLNQLAHEKSLSQ